MLYVLERVAAGSGNPPASPSRPLVDRIGDQAWLTMPSHCRGLEANLPRMLAKAPPIVVGSGAFVRKTPGVFLCTTAP